MRIPACVYCHPEVATYLTRRKASSLEQISERFGQELDVRESKGLRQDQFKLAIAASHAP